MPYILGFLSFLYLAGLSGVHYGDCVSLEVEVKSDRKTRSLPTGAKEYQVLPHSDLEFSCIVSGMEQGMVLQIVKVQIKLEKHGGMVELYKPTTWPYVLANGDSLDETLMETGRYTVSEGKEGSVTMLVSSCLQDDTGLWACRILKNGQEYMISEIDLLVLGPVQGIHLRQSLYPAKNKSFDIGEKLQTSEGVPQDLSCTIFITNWLPDVVLSISDAGSDYYKNITGLFTIARAPETLYYSAQGERQSPLRQYYGQITYKVKDLEFTSGDNLKRLYCTTMGGPFLSPKHDYLRLDVKFRPNEGRCDKVKVMGHKVYLTCSVRSNPEPKLIWTVLDNVDLEDENLPISFSQMSNKDLYSSTLMIDGFNASFYGEYKMTASNDLGSTTVPLRLSQEAVSQITGSAPTLCVPWILITYLLVNDNYYINKIMTSSPL